jgi:hypothetical protein
MPGIKSAMRRLSTVKFHARQNWSGSWDVRLHNKIVIVAGVPEAFANELQMELNGVLGKYEAKLREMEVHDPRQEVLPI